MKDEFRATEELHRFEASIMLGQTAVYLVATGALFSAIIGKAEDISLWHRRLVAILGVILSIAFFIITHRSGRNLIGARRRATALAKELGYQLYSASYRAPANRFWTGCNMTRGICLAGGLLWAAVLLLLMANAGS